MKKNTDAAVRASERRRTVRIIKYMMVLEKRAMRNKAYPGAGVVEIMMKMEAADRQRKRRAAERAERMAAAAGPSEKRAIERVIEAMYSMESSLGKRGTPGQRKRLGRKPSRSVREMRAAEAMARTGKKRGRKKLPPFNYRIVECRDGRGLRTVGRYRTAMDAGEAFRELRKRSAGVVFPCLTSGIGVRADIHYEYILIERSDGEQELLRNEYGKFVPQETDIDGWVILDKFRFTPEETFWVWGLSNRGKRKTFEWIYENIITAGLTERSDFKRVMVYRNKFLIRDDDGKLDMVICKTEGDAARFYSTLKAYARKKRMRQILFFGDCENRAEGAADIEEEIREMTGWTMRKVRMRSNTFYASSERILREIEEKRNASDLTFPLD